MHKKLPKQKKTVVVLCTMKPLSKQQAVNQDNAMTLCKSNNVLPFIILKENKPDYANILLKLIPSSSSSKYEYPQFFLKFNNSNETEIYWGDYDTIKQLNIQGQFKSSLYITDESLEQEPSSSSSPTKDQQQQHQQQHQQQEQHSNSNKGRLDNMFKQTSKLRLSAGKTPIDDVPDDDENSTLNDSGDEENNNNNANTTKSRSTSYGMADEEEKKSSSYRNCNTNTTSDDDDNGDDDDDNNDNADGITTGDQVNATTEQHGGEREHHLEKLNQPLQEHESDNDSLGDDIQMIFDPPPPPPPTEPIAKAISGGTTATTTSEAIIEEDEEEEEDDDFTDDEDDIADDEASDKMTHPKGPASATTTNTGSSNAAAAAPTTTTTFNESLQSLQGPVPEPERESPFGQKIKLRSIKSSSSSSPSPIKSPTKTKAKATSNNNDVPAWMQILKEQEKDEDATSSSSTIGNKNKPTSTSKSTPTSPSPSTTNSWMSNAVSSSASSSPSKSKGTTTTITKPSTVALSPKKKSPSPYSATVSPPVKQKHASSPTKVSSSKSSPSSSPLAPPLETKSSSTTDTTLPNPSEQDHRQDHDQQHQQPKKKHQLVIPEGVGAVYLVYDAVQGELNIYYSEVPIIAAVGVWTSSDILEFKQAQGLSQSELIGNCASNVADRKNYFAGWVQFIKAAKSMDATVMSLDVGVPVDFFLYHPNGETTKAVDGTFETTDIDAVACVPRGCDFDTTLVGKKWSKHSKKQGGAVALFKTLSSSRDGGTGTTRTSTTNTNTNTTDTSTPTATTEASPATTTATTSPDVVEPAVVVSVVSSSHHTTQMIPENKQVASGQVVQERPTTQSSSSIQEQQQPKDEEIVQSDMPTMQKVSPESPPKKNEGGSPDASGPSSPGIPATIPPPVENIADSSIDVVDGGDGGDGDGVYKSALDAPNPDGGACYLVYEPDSSGRLVEVYSKVPVADAIGRWTPGPPKKIAGFKFKQNLGKNVLIGNCSAGVQGRKSYASGWNQFVRSAKVMNGGDVMLWDPVGKGLMVDVYLYTNSKSSADQTVKLERGVPVTTNNVLAVACIPKGTGFYKGMSVDILKWLADGSTYGSSSKFQ